MTGLTDPLEEIATERAQSGTLSLHLARGTLDQRARYERLRAAARAFEAAARVTRTLALEAKPPKMLRAPAPKAGPRPRVFMSAPIGVDCGADILAARERAELSESDAARSLSMRLKDYRELEAGTKSIRITTAERIARIEWIGTELGSRLVETVRSAADLLTTGQVTALSGQVSEGASAEGQRTSEP